MRSRGAATTFVSSNRSATGEKEVPAPVEGGLADSPLRDLDSLETAFALLFEFSIMLSGRGKRPKRARPHGHACATRVGSRKGWHGHPRQRQVGPARRPRPLLSPSVRANGWEKGISWL